MLKEEMIELNGKEYTLTLNRQSALKIEQYTNFQKNMNEMATTSFNHIEEIKKGENPFEDEIDIEKIEEENLKKVETLKVMIAKAFWLWLYPKHKLDYDEVYEMIVPYFEDEEKTTFISNEYGRLLKESTEIQEKYMEELKNLKALANK